MEGKTIRRDDLIEPELSYKIVGVLLRVYNELGPGLHEKYYQKAVAVGLREVGLPFKMEMAIPLVFSSVKVGRYFADFVVADKIIVELKAGNHINRQHAKQLLT